MGFDGFHRTVRLTLHSLTFTRVALNKMSSFAMNVHVKIILTVGRDFGNHVQKKFLVIFCAPFRFIFLCKLCFRRNRAAT